LPLPLLQDYSDRMQEKKVSYWIGGGLAAYLAFAQFRLIVYVLGPNYGQSVEAAYGVVIGKPHWREVQNRVLAPFLVYGVSGAFPTYLSAHVAYSLITLTIGGFLAFRIGRRHGGEFVAGLAALAGFHLAFAFLLSRPWLYAWDYLEIITFLLFAEFVLSGRKWPWFAGLFAIAIFNRESALIIPIWMILHPICRWLFGRFHLAAVAGFDRPMAAAGLLAIPIGVAVILMLRELLFVQAVGPLIFRDAAMHDAQFERLLINLVPNLQGSWTALTQPGVDMPFVIPLFVLLAIACSLWLAWRFPVPLTAFTLAFLGLVCVALVVGTLFETRILLNLVPVVLVAALLPRDSRPTGWAAAHGSPTLGELWRRRRQHQLALH
jgi:hypothetical protein